MGRASLPPSLTGDGNTSARLFRPDEIMEVRREDGTILCVVPRKGSLRILIVDDCKDAADSMAILVNLWGHDGRVAYGGEVALEMAWAYQPGVMLLDLAMPGIGGYEVARQLRRHGRFKETVLIATTGYADEAYRLVAVEAGFDQYLIKPMEPLMVQELLRIEAQRLSACPEISRNSPNVALKSLLSANPEHLAATNAFAAEPSPAARGPRRTTARRQ